MLGIHRNGLLGESKDLNHTIELRQLTDALRGYGGVILIDDREVDDLVALLTTCTMLRRAEQRRWERSGGAHGGGS